MSDEEPRSIDYSSEESTKRSSQIDGSNNPLPKRPRMNAAVSKNANLKQVEMDNSQFSEMLEAVDKLFSHREITEDDIKSLQESIFTNIIPQFNEAIILTDLLGVPRNNLFNSINNAFIDKIKSEIEMKNEKLDEKKQQKLWLKLMKSGHKYIHHPVMQPLIMHVMGKMTNVKEFHLSEILKSKELYEKTPINVLRHVWLEHPNKLNEEIDQLIDLYIAAVWRQQHSQCEEAITRLVSQRSRVYSSAAIDLTPYILVHSKKRRQDSHLARIIDMIGESKTLCENIMKILQDRFVDGQLKKESPISINPISTLRIDVVMSLHEKHLSRLFDADDLHMLILHLNSCVRDRTIDNARSIDLCKQMKEHHNLAKDLEFICTDPFVLYTTAVTILSATIDGALSKKKLPRQISKLTFLCSLMSYGLTDFDSDGSIDRTHSSLKSPSFTTKKRSTFSFENDSSSSWTKDEIIETLMLNVLPNVQHTHISVKREHICNQKNKVNASVLKRSASESVPAPTKHAIVPTQYLSNPLGRLFIQYHCILALQRKEFFLLKLLLTTISTSRRSDHRPTVEWRPELLQALIFGICGLQNTNEKIMNDFFNLLRPVIPMSSVFFQLLYLVTISALKDITEIERLIEAFQKHPNVDIDSTVIATGKSLRELVDIILKGFNKDSQILQMTPIGNRMMMPTPSYMLTPGTPLPMRTPYHSQTSIETPRYSTAPQSFFSEPSPSTPSSSVTLPPPRFGSINKPY